MEYIILKWISSLCIRMAINLVIDKQPDWITVRELEQTNRFYHNLFIYLNTPSPLCICYTMTTYQCFFTLFLPHLDNLVAKPLWTLIPVRVVYPLLSLSKGNG